MWSFIVYAFSDFALCTNCPDWPCLKKNSCLKYCSAWHTRTNKKPLEGSLQWFPIHTHKQRLFYFQLHQKLQNASIVEKIKIYDNTNRDLRY